MNNNKISELRRQRGWSQEKLATISGLSERTIQRVEKEGRFSLSTKAALANAFGVEVNELESSVEAESIQSSQASKSSKCSESISYSYDWGGAFGLLILGLCIPAIILLTGTHGKWELASFGLVIGLTLTMAVMNHGIKAIYRLFDNTSWIVRYPSYVKDIDTLIAQGKMVNRTAYGIGAIVSLVSAITLAIHNPQVFSQMSQGLALSLKPLIYAILFVEFWFRPYVRKMEKIQKLQEAS
ncbi:helix-turn-helix transcriptional regulator [Thalassotalea litorea]|uniref:Helix-turn-helix transcriptional regulator n=1 Tax=Thalassotalea litorea TaxID=2020715 RepID=A0A5R9IUW4_9GAMM|nr:helix-turn-helix transcriptional regulator [Thalassotalea litorea]TLU67141.1 helix-turn-helix transcriptional regulator [Thalassotalea litorea]